LALAARTAALLPPFAEQGPAAEQVLLEHDLVIARRVGSDRPGLHEDSHGRIVPGARRLHRAPGRRGAAAGSRASAAKQFAYGAFGHVAHQFGAADAAPEDQAQATAE